MERKDIFHDKPESEYVVAGYIDLNPGYTAANTLISYVGIYFNANGVLSGKYERNPNNKEFFE